MSRRKLLVLLTAVIGAGFCSFILAGTVTRAGLIFHQEQPATATDLPEGPGNNSPRLLADPVDPRLVVLVNRLDSPDFSCGMELSGDGGEDWVPVRAIKALPAGVEKCYAPEIAFDRRGRLYFLFVGLAGGGNHPVGVWLETSNDGGFSFSEPRRVLGPDNFDVRMALDASFGPAGRVHLVWLHSSSPPALGGFQPSDNPVLTAYSDDGGQTFSTPVRVSDVGRARVVSPALALGQHHEVYVAYFDLRNDARDYEGLEGPVWTQPWSVEVSASRDGGATFGPSVDVDRGVVPSSRVMLIFTMPAPSLVSWRGNVCVTWSDGRYGEADILIRCSGSRGATWKRLIQVNPDPAGDGHKKYLPTLSVSPGGRVSIAYLSRVDPLGDYYAVEFSSSMDGGGRFSHPVQLDLHVSDARIGAQYGNVSADGQVENGSRLGLVSIGENRIVAAWPDTGNTTSTSADEDIHTRVIAVAGGGRGRAVATSLVWLAVALVGTAFGYRASRGQAG